MILNEKLIQHDVKTLFYNLEDFPLSVLLLRLESSVSLLIISGKFNLSSQDLQHKYFCPNILVIKYVLPLLD